MTLRDALPLGIFALAYLVLARGNLPPLRLDRAGAALVGAVAMVVSGAVSPEEAQAAISFPTLMLLLGMMIVVANLRLSGAFTVAAQLVLARARTPRALLALTIDLAGVLAAVFINDVVCLGAHAARARRDGLPRPRPRAVPARARDRRQRRERGHHHGESAEHDRRGVCGARLPPLRGATGPRGGARAGRELRGHRAPLPPPPRSAPPSPAPAPPAPPAVAAPLEVGGRLARRAGGLRRRLPDPPRGPRRGRRPAPHPAPQARAHLRRHRLDHAPDVRGPVRGRARPRSDGAARGRAAHPRPQPPRAPAGPDGGHGRALEPGEQRPCRAALSPAPAAPR